MRSLGIACVMVAVWLVTALAVPRPAHAQTDGWLAAGAGIMQRVSPADDASGSTAPMFLVRIGRGREGWGVRYGLNWFATDLDRSLDGRTQRFGRLRVRPVMLGYGYGRRYRRAYVSLNLKAGYAFASFRLQPTFADAYGAVLNTTAVQADASNTFVLKPDVVAWIDLSRTIGLHIGAGYIMARPHVAVTSAAGSERRRLQADTLLVQVGAVYSVF